MSKKIVFHINMSRKVVKDLNVGSKYMIWGTCKKEGPLFYESSTGRSGEPQTVPEMTGSTVILW